VRGSASEKGDLVDIILLQSKMAIAATGNMVAKPQLLIKITAASANVVSS